MANTDEPVNPDEPTVDLSKEVPATTPVLEQILEGINSLREEVVAMRGDLGELKKTVHSLERRFDVYTQDLMRMRGDILNHENRIEGLERKAS